MRALLLLLASAAATELGRLCRRDSECRAADPGLRCFGRPGLMRCACRHRWRPQGGVCRGPKGEGGRAREEGGGEDLVAVVAPSLLLAAGVLMVSLCCCYQVHKGSRELHRELRKEERKVEEAGERYRVASRPATAPASRQLKESLEEEVSSDSSDSDSGLFEMAELGQADRIVTVSVTEETEESHLSSVPPPRPLSARSLARPASASLLHPLHGLLRPTGRPPQAGYQANMRLLFSHRPGSAEAARPAAAGRSRPASAISRFEVFPPAIIQEKEEALPRQNGSLVIESEPEKHKTHRETNGTVVVENGKVGESKKPKTNDKIPQASENVIVKKVQQTQPEKSKSKKQKKARKASTQSRSGSELAEAVAVEAGRAGNTSVSCQRTIRRSVSSDSSLSSRPSSGAQETVAERILR